MELGSVCVFSGSSPGARPSYEAAARALGATLARERIRLVYGGARVGLMGHLADAARANGGAVVGVIPAALVDREVAHDGLDELHVVDGMHERKATMNALADAFVALPGGVGTLEELFEAWTWRQLGLHDKPVGILDVDGYWERLRGFLDHAAAEGFVRTEELKRLVVADGPAELLACLRRAEAGPFRPERATRARAGAAADRRR